MLKAIKFNKIFKNKLKSKSEIKKPNYGERSILSKVTRNTATLTDRVQAASLIAHSYKDIIIMIVWRWTFSSRRGAVALTPSETARPEERGVRSPGTKYSNYSNYIMINTGHSSRSIFPDSSKILIHYNASKHYFNLRLLGNSRNVIALYYLRNITSYLVFKTDQSSYRMTMANKSSVMFYS